jgi:response regulator of citrate/malate metabolism
MVQAQANEDMDYTEADLERDVRLARMLNDLELCQPRQEGEFITDELAEEAHLSRATVRRRAEELVQAGTWIKRPGVINGRKGWYYRKVQDK